MRLQKNALMALKCLLTVIAFTLSCSKSTEETGVPESPQVPFSVKINTAGIKRTPSSAEVTFSLEATGSGTVKSKGVCWNISPTPTTSHWKAEATGTEVFTATLRDLTSGTKYFVRSYAVDDKNTVHYSAETSFSTLNNIKLTTLPVVVSSERVVEFRGTIAIGGGEVIKSRGFCYGTTPTPALNNQESWRLDASGTGADFSAVFSGATPQTTYYVRTFAIDQNDEVLYGEIISFNTSTAGGSSGSANPSGISVTTIAATSLTTSSALVGGNVGISGVGVVTAKGICWATTSNPTITNSKTALGGGAGSFQSSLTGLQPNTRYFARAYATDASQATTYGNEISFTTSNNTGTQNGLTITTTSLTSITSNSAKSGGTIVVQGLENVSARGVCWSTTPTPTTSNWKTSQGSGAGSYQSDLTGLTANIKYYVRAYATNGSGVTFYGNELSFTTASSTTTPPPPTQPTWSLKTIQPQAATITNFSAKVGWLFENRSSFTDKYSGNSFYVLFSRSPNISFSTSERQVPVTETSEWSSGEESISGFGIPKDGTVFALTPNTKWYARACISGESFPRQYYYGNEISFTTKEEFTVTTVGAAVTPGSIEFYGRVYNTASEKYTTAGLVWSVTNSVPTVTDNKLTNVKFQEMPSGNMGFSAPIQTQQGGVKHYFRAYTITNAGRTVYGDVLTAISEAVPSGGGTGGGTGGSGGGTGGSGGSGGSTGGTGSSNSCLLITNKGRVNSCTNAYSVTVKNNCSYKVDIRIILRKSSGTIDAGIGYGINPGATYTYYTCSGSGQFQIQSRPSTSTTPFPEPSNSWQQ